MQKTIVTFYFTENTLYCPSFEVPFNDLTQKDHLWIKVSVDFKASATDDNKLPILIISIQRDEGEYAYYAKSLISDLIDSSKWSNFELDYLTPNLRSRRDRLKVYIWNKESIDCEIDNLTIKLFEKK